MIRPLYNSRGGGVEARTQIMHFIFVYYYFTEIELCSLLLLLVNYEIDDKV